MRVTINIAEEEQKALVLLARNERRDPREQAALLLRRELQALGLLPTQIPAQRGTDDVATLPVVTGEARHATHTN